MVYMRCIRLINQLETWYDFVKVVTLTLLCNLLQQEVVSGRQRMARNWRQFGSDKNLGPHNGGDQVSTLIETMMSKWFSLKKLSSVLSFFSFYFENRRELSYLWSEWLLVSVCGVCVCGSREGELLVEWVAVSECMWLVCVWQSWR